MDDGIAIFRSTVHARQHGARTIVWWYSENVLYVYWSIFFSGNRRHEANNQIFFVLVVKVELDQQKKA